MIDLTDRKFNHLTVLNEAERIGDKRTRRWQCRCVCNKVVTVEQRKLRSGGQKSCGCQREGRIENLHRAPPGNRLSFGVAAMRAVLGDYKWGAGKRHLCFDLSENEARHLFQGTCFYCDAPPSKISAPPGAHGHYVHNGIDRLDTDKGYTLDNVVSCCSRCNALKNKLSYSRFAELMHAIAKRHTS